MCALTGESIPVEKSKEIMLLPEQCEVMFYLAGTKLSHETVFSNIIRMVEEAQKRPSKVSKFVTVLSLSM